MRDNDVTDLIVNALTGVCNTCKGQGWVHSTNAIPVPFDVDEEAIELCGTCGGVGEV